MKKDIVFMMGLLLIAGCAKKSNDTALVIQCDDLNSTVVNQPKEPIVNSFEKTSMLEHNDHIKFEEASTLGRGDHIKVKKIVKVGPNHSQYKRLKGRPVLVTIGWISNGRDGIYRYYEPETNELNPIFTETDLEILKNKIRLHRSNS
jgi:hypothetical protein